MMRLIRWCLIVLSLFFALATQAQTGDFPTTWDAEYFDNPYLAGEPIVKRFDDSIGFDWGNAAPIDGLPNDNFSVRWGKGGYLPAGIYQFILTVDEGVRLRVNDQILIDTWETPTPGKTYGVEIFLEAGDHRIQIDYREFSYLAFIYLDWGLVPGGRAAPQPSTEGEQIATVTASLLNVRDEPSIANNIISRIARGQQFPVVAVSDDEIWVQLELGNNTRGWVSAAYIVIDGAGVGARADSNLIGTTLRANGRLLVRSEPSGDAEVVGLLRPQEIVPIIARNGDMTWWQIRDGAQIGWVNALYVTISSDVEPARVIVAGE